MRSGFYLNVVVSLDHYLHLSVIVDSDRAGRVSLRVSVISFGTSSTICVYVSDINLSNLCYNDSRIPTKIYLFYFQKVPYNYNSLIYY